MTSVTTPVPASTAFRTDIQALRGLAIVLVVLYHAKLGFLRAGYLGVDIFFVVSGFLITRIVQQAISLGTFSFAKFYYRRAKRLLPAAYVVFAVTALLSQALLTTVEMRDFVKQLVGAITFTGNVALWLQAGYFESAAHLKPLLHVWSLSIEEQYYLLLPAALVLTPRRYWVLGTILLLFASLSLCLVLAPIHPGATFYLLPTRGWELAIGSLGALVQAESRFRSMLARSFWPALLALLVVPFAPTGVPYPGLDAVIVCIATLAVILRGHPLMNDRLLPICLAKVGDFSYSLYLVHWPLFAFANNTYLTEVPAGIRAGLVVVSFVLGYLLYRFVELPMRRADIALSRKSVAAAVSASLFVIVLTLGASKFSSNETDFAYIRRSNLGFGAACAFGSNFAPVAECRNSEAPRLLVWGDSVAMHLVPGLAADGSVGVVQATMAVCGPFVGLAPFDAGDYPRSFAERCLQFNQSVLDYLAKTPTIEVVALSSAFAQYLDKSAWGREFRTLSNQTGLPIARDASMPDAIKFMQGTIRKIRALGKRVVVIAPPPSADFDIGLCLERKSSGKMLLGSNTGCEIAVSTYRRQNALVLTFLSRLALEADVGVIGFEELLCSRLSCQVEIDGTFIYRDGAHFTYDGSRAVARKMDLATRVMASAR